MSREYLVYCKKYKDTFSNENDEEYVMTFNKIDNAIDFIKMCTLYDMIYKIYCVQNNKKELVSIYKYYETNKPNDKIYCGFNLKKTWQPIDSNNF